MTADTWGYYNERGYMYLLKNGTLTPIPDLPGGREMGHTTSINNNEKVVGYSNTATNDHAFCWTAATGTEDLGILPGSDYSGAYHINDNGVIVGFVGYGPEGDDVRRAVLWDGSHTIHDLGYLSSAWPNSDAVGINESGDVAGYSLGSSTDMHAVLWKNGTDIIDLNQCLVNNTEWAYLSHAYGINDLGQIVGEGVLKTGETHAFLLDPAAAPNTIPLPGALLLATTGWGLASVLRRRRILR
jgi:probable HAF family extracellular repeat protein